MPTENMESYTQQLKVRLMRVPELGLNKREGCAHHKLKQYSCEKYTHDCIEEGIPREYRVYLVTGTHNHFAKANYTANNSASVLHLIPILVQCRKYTICLPLSLTTPRLY
jgi:hypothetical protein